MEKERGLTYCRKDRKWQPALQKTSTKRCPDCGHKIRGINHVEGRHHKQGVQKKGV